MYRQIALLVGVSLDRVVQCRLLRSAILHVMHDHLQDVVLLQL